MLEMSLTPTQATIDAARRSQELFERFGDHQEAAFSKLMLAFAELQYSGPSAAALRLVEEGGATFEELGDPWGEAFAGHARLAFEAYTRGVPEWAEEAGQRALNGSRPSTTSGAWPRRSSASGTSPRSGATWPRPRPPSSVRWAPPARGDRCG
jgi:hypothetical protein